MDKEFLYVLDHSDTTLNVIYLHNGDIDPYAFKDAEELLAYWGFKADQCAWMFSDIELNLNHIIVPPDK